MQVEFISRNPRTEEVLARFDLLSNSELERIVAKSSAAQKLWRKKSVVERASIIKHLGEQLEADANGYATLIETEMGKLHDEAVLEVKKCASLCLFTADSAPKTLEPLALHIEGTNVSIRHEALGVMLAVMPWNFPFWQVFRACVPVLMSGNTILLKHAPNTPQCALAIEKIFEKAAPGLSLLHSLFIDNDQIHTLIANKAIRGVTLTGSKRAGVAVATAAAQAIKPCVLELGGSDPFLVFADADLDEAVRVATTSRLLSNGQSCIAAKRFIVEHVLYDQFVTRLTEQMKARVIGPLANEQQQQTLKAQVDDAIQKGAKVHCGGTTGAEKGYFYQPTVLTNLNDTMKVAHEEVFGPVACVWAFANDDEALALANTTDYGLGATLFTRDQKRIERFAFELESGQVFVNEMVRSDPRFPFGGIKESGLGRELGERAPLSFTNEKAVCIKKA